MIILTGASAGDAWPTLFSANHMSIVSTLQRRESSAAVTGDTDSEEGGTGLSLEVEASGDTLQIVYHTQRCNELVDYVECGIVGALESSSEGDLTSGLEGGLIGVMRIDERVLMDNTRFGVQAALPFPHKNKRRVAMTHRRDVAQINRG